MIDWHKINWEKTKLIDDHEGDSDFWDNLKIKCWEEFLDANLPKGEHDDVHEKEYLVSHNGDVFLAIYDDENEYPTFWINDRQDTIEPDFWAEINLPEALKN